MKLLKLTMGKNIKNFITLTEGLITEAFSQLVMRCIYGTCIFLE